MKLLMTGSAFALIGLLVGLYVLFSSIGGGYSVIALYAPIASALVSVLLWYFFIVRQDDFYPKTGAIVGGVSGILSHYVCWYLLFIHQNICYHVFGKCADSLNEGPIGLLDGLWAAGLYSMGSLLFYGWFTVGAGVVLGAILAYRQA